MHQVHPALLFFFFFNDTATPEIYTLSLHDALPISRRFGAPTPGSPGADDSMQVRIPRPPHWGGYRLWADAVELWVQGEARIHDRALWTRDRKSTRLNSSHDQISYAVFCLKKKNRTY